MKLMSTIPALPVRDIEAAVTFYRARLGFDIGYHDSTFAITRRDQVEIHLWAANDESWMSRPTVASRPVQSGAESFLAGTASCRLEVQGIDELYAEYKEKEVLYNSETAVEEQPWGTREFPALDLERNLLTFYERL
jgi:catechol 2,3-dioxygenase-like lactoylglutathione lyase family enzyme